MNDEAKKDLEDLKKIIQKQFGKGSVQNFSDQPIFDKDRIIHTGSISLDTILGVGGYPKGRMIEIFGMESSGKTTLALEAIAECQATGGRCAFIDTEHALDIIYSKALNIDVDDLLFSQPDCAEEALEILNIIARSKMVDLVVLDSIAALVPRAELEGEAGDSHVGLQARLMSQAMRKLAGILSKTATTVIFLNQTRSKVGVMYGSPLTTSGGNALKYYASQRVQLRRTTNIGDDNNPSGIRVNAKIVKNKVAPPFRQTQFNIKFGRGIDRTTEILDLALADGLMTKKGSWYKYNEETVSQGAAGATEWLDENEEIKDSLKTEILETRGMM